MNENKIVIEITSDEFLLLCQILNKTKMTEAAEEKIKETLQNRMIKGYANKFFCRF